MARRATFGISFLDVISNATGAVIVLAVIFSMVKQRAAAPTSGEFILGTCEATGEGRLGVVLDAPAGRSLAVFVPHGETDLTRGRSEIAGGIRCWQSWDEGRSRIFVEVSEPVAGTWSLRPYFVDYVAPNASVGQELTTIKARFWTRTTHPDSPSESSKVAAPSFEGDSAFKVEITR